MGFIENYSLRPGDVIITPKSDLNVVQHYIVFEQVDYYGTPWYLENKQGHGVRRISHHTFVKENPTFTRIRRLRGTDYQRQQAINRGLSLIGRQYNLAGFNCEDFANYVQYGEAYSHQTRWGVGLTIFAALLIFGGIGASTGGKK